MLKFPCVQSNADVFSGGSPAGARASSPVAWMAGQRETDALEPIDEALERRVSESPACDRLCPLQHPVHLVEVDVRQERGDDPTWGTPRLPDASSISLSK